MQNGKKPYPKKDIQSIGKSGRDAAQPVVGAHVSFMVIASVSLAIFIACGAAMIRVSAPTYDEGVNLASGYTNLIQGHRILDGNDHPPLVMMWSALPLLTMKPLSFFERPQWLKENIYNYADLFLYKNRVAAERMMNSARLWALFSCSILLAVPILLWCRRLGGTEGMVAGSLIFAFCPPLFSNAALVANDAASAALFFLSFWLLSQEERSPRLWAAAGITIGLAMAAKFNMAFLPPLALGVCIADWKARGKGQSFPTTGLWLAALVAFLALAAVYRFINIGIYWDGLTATFTRLDQGRGSFLLGAHSATGWLWYFPVALAVKTPIPLLAAAVIGTMAWKQMPRRQLWWLLAPPVAYFAVACLSKTQIGYRHILPVYPFLIVQAAMGATWLWRKATTGRVACGLLSVWLAISVVGSGPHYLTYFNEVAGGSAGGYRWLVDSNLDWGQGLKPLAQALKDRGNPPVFLSYFGSADPSFYGIRYIPIGWTTNVNRREGTAWPAKGDPLLLAVSATNLQATYYQDKTVFAWLKDYKPVAVPGHSIFLYDLTRNPKGALELASLIDKVGRPDAAQRIRLDYAHVQH